MDSELEKIKRTLDEIIQRLERIERRQEALVEHVEDLEDAIEADQALREMEQTGEEPKPWEEIKEQLRL